MTVLEEAHQCNRLRAAPRYLGERNGWKRGRECDVDSVEIFYSVKGSAVYRNQHGVNPIKLNIQYNYIKMYFFK